MEWAASAGNELPVTGVNKQKLERVSAGCRGAVCEVPR